MKKYLSVYAIICVFSCFTTSLLADSTLVVLNNQGCFNCYAGLSNLKDNEFVYVYVQGYSERKTQKFIKKYFDGFNFKSTEWCPDELKGSEGVAMVKDGSIDYFLPLGWYYSDGATRKINLDEYGLSESLVYSVSENSVIIKDRAFNECLVMADGDPFLVDISDSSTQSQVYSKLGLLEERKLIKSITSQLGGGINQLLIMGDMKTVGDKLHALVSIRRYSENTLFTQPAIVIMDFNKTVEEVITFGKDLTYRIGTRTFSVLQDGTYQFVLTPAETEKRPNGYEFICTFKGNDGEFQLLDTLSFTVDSFHDGVKNKFNASSIYSVDGCWAYTVIPAFFDAQAHQEEEEPKVTKLREYDSFRLGYDDEGVFNVDYKFKGISRLNKDTYLILYRFKEELKFKVFSKDSLVGFGSLGNVDSGSATFLAGNLIYQVEGNQLLIRDLFGNY